MPNPVENPEPETKAQRLSRIAAGLALLAVAIWMLTAFLPALAWATVLTIATWPLFVAVRRRSGQTQAAAAVPGGRHASARRAGAAPRGRRRRRRARYDRRIAADRHWRGGTARHCLCGQRRAAPRHARRADRRALRDPVRFAARLHRGS